MFKTKSHGENTSRQLESVSKGARLSSTPAHLKGTKRDTAVRWIPIDRVIAKKQIREEFDEEELNELAASFRELGQQTACLVYWSEIDEAFVIVAGERRFRAAQLANKDTLKCNVMDHEPSDQEHLELQLVENVQRTDLSAIEESKAYQRFIDEFGYTQAQIAKRTGKNQSSISRALKLMKLPTEIRDELARTNAARTLAEKLVRLKTIDEQRDMLERHQRGELTVRDAQDETAKPSSRGGSRKPGAKQTRVKKARGIDFRATGKKKHTNTDYALGTLDWCEDLATDKRATVDVAAVTARLRELVDRLNQQPDHSGESITAKAA